MRDSPGSSLTGWLSGWEVRLPASQKKSMTLTFRVLVRLYLYVQDVGILENGQQRGKREESIEQG